MCPAHALRSSFSYLAPTRLLAEVDAKGGLADDFVHEFAGCYDTPRCGAGLATVTGLKVPAPRFLWACWWPGPTDTDALERFSPSRKRRGRKRSLHPIEIRRGWASLAFGSVSVSTPSSSCAPICSWLILLDSANDRV